MSSYQKNWVSTLHLYRHVVYGQQSFCNVHDWDLKSRNAWAAQKEDDDEGRYVEEWHEQAQNDDEDEQTSVEMMMTMMITHCISLWSWWWGERSKIKIINSKSQHWLWYILIGLIGVIRHYWTYSEYERVISYGVSQIFWQESNTFFNIFKRSSSQTSNILLILAGYFSLLTILPEN